VDRLRLRRIEAIVTGYRGDRESAIKLLEEVGQALYNLGELGERASIMLDLAEFMASIPRIESAFRSLNEAHQIYRESGDLLGQAWVYDQLGGLFFCTGEVSKAEENFAKASELGRKLGIHGFLVWVHLYWGLVYDAAGMFQQAFQQGLKALEVAELSEAPYPEVGVFCNLTRSYLRENRLDDAEKSYSRMNELFEEHGKDASLTLQAFVARTRGFYHASRGDVDRADAAYTSSITLVHKGPLSAIHEAETRREYADWLMKQDRKEEARNHLKETLSLYESLNNKSGVDSTNRKLVQLR